MLGLVSVPTYSGVAVDSPFAGDPGRFSLGVVVIRFLRTMRRLEAGQHAHTDVVGDRGRIVQQVRRIEVKDNGDGSASRKAHKRGFRQDPTRRVDA